MVCKSRDAFQNVECVRGVTKLEQQIFARAGIASGTANWGKNCQILGGYKMPKTGRNGSKS